MFVLNVSVIVIILSTWCQLVWALPTPSHSKRIGQTLTAATAKWRAACTSAGGSLECLTAASTAEISLTASAGVCDQQDAADSMMSLAKILGSPLELVEYTQLFLQQPRDTSSSLATPYCQKAPKNKELSGFYQCQFESSSKTEFVGGLKVGKCGTIPFGLAKAIAPAGGCPAHPSGPIADASQLTDITSRPILVNGGSSESNPIRTVFHTVTATETITFVQKTATFGATPTLTLSV